MELIILLVAVTAIAALIYYNRTARSLDVNNDGKIDLEDAKTAVDNTVTGVTVTVEKAAVQAKAAVKKPAAKKPARSKK